MALDPLELGAIAAIVVVFFLWGPQKIPELARMVGRARREFENASKEFQSVTTSIGNGTSALLAPETTAPVSQPPAGQTGAKTGDQLLIEAARRLGIPTQGKTREQIQQDIIAMAQRPPSAREESAPPASKDDPAA